MLAQGDESGSALGWALEAAPLIVVLAMGGLAIWRAEKWYEHKPRSLVRPVAMLVLTVLVLVAAIIAAPIDNETRGQLVALLGVGLTAVIALASTTFVSNAMAGLMLRSLRNFAPGDFIEVEDRFGRVTERGLFHTEIQTEERALTTIPNLLLATKPTTVIRADGTILSTEVSLGYDAPRGDVEAALLEGAATAELEKPFVQVMNLGDFTVTYRVAGMLKNVKYLVSARSNLRACVMDALHEAGIEIVSPTFMNQRRIDERPVMPVTRSQARDAANTDGAAPEDVMFDKADEAAKLEDLERELEGLREDLATSDGEDADEKRVRAERLEKLVAQRREDQDREKREKREKRETPSDGDAEAAEEPETP
jgi:small conductance mechanosensitive channel